MEIIQISLIVVLSYFLGAIPSAVIVSKRFFGFDIRTKGSGNMGSTNAFRVLGWKWGITVQIMDIVKGVLAVTLVAGLIGEGIQFHSITMFEDTTIVKFIAGISAVCGHIWSVFVGFRGGKGVNTAAGMLLGIAPFDFGIAVAAFLLAVVLSGYISLGSISGALAFPSSLLIRYNIFGVDIPGYHILIYFAVVVAGLLIFAHRSNIKRLLKGTENRFEKLYLLKFKSKPKNN